MLLTFLVIYPVSMLLLGALTNTNPVVDGFGVFDLSLANFVTVLTNPNVLDALINSLIACGGGTAVAVALPARAVVMLSDAIPRWWPSPGPARPRAATAAIEAGPAAAGCGCRDCPGCARRRHPASGRGPWRAGS